MHGEVMKVHACMVSMVGFEPTSIEERILSPPRMPFRHIDMHTATSGSYLSLFRRERLTRVHSISVITDLYTVHMERTRYNVPERPAAIHGNCWNLGRDCWNRTSA